MKILRYAAGVVLFLFGALFCVAGYALQRYASPSVQQAIAKHGGSTEFYVTLAIMVGTYWTAAYQVVRGKGRGFAWWASGILGLSLLIPSPLTPVFVLPLAYLIAEITHPYWSRGKKPDAQTERGTAHSKGVLLEWLFTIPMVILAGYLMKVVPAVPQPKHIDDGWLVFASYVWLIIFTHELGHALAGAAMKFDLVSFCVCPFELRRTRTWSVSWNPKLGGHYLGLPRTPENLWQRHVIIIAAGPAVNFVTFALLWAVLRLANGTIDGAAFGLLHGVMHFSLLTGIINLVPVKIGGFKTDGRYLFEAFFLPAESRRSLAMLGALASRSASLRPRDWPVEWVEALRSGPDDQGAIGLMNLWAQDRLLTAPDDLAALSVLTDSTLALERLAAQTTDAQVASAFRFHVAWLRCRYDGITDGAAETIAPARKDPHTDPHEILRLQAALAAAAGHTGEASQLLDQAEQSLLKLPPSGFHLSDLDDLRAFRAGLAPAA